MELKSNDSSFLCRHCGRFVKSGEYGGLLSYPICPKCNRQFWAKWYQLPTKCKLVENTWIRSEAHEALIKEYHKEDYFKWKNEIFQ